MASKKVKKDNPFKTGRMETPSGGGGFVSIKGGETLTLALLHGLDQMISANMHEYWEITPAIFHPCLGTDCPGCEAGNKARSKGYMGVVDRDGQVMVWPFTSSVYNQLEALEDTLLEDAKDGEDPLVGYVVKFGRIGSGLNTKYSVVGVGKYVDVSELEMPEIVSHLGETDRGKIIEKLEEAGVELGSDDKFGDV